MLTDSVIANDSANPVTNSASWKSPITGWIWS